MATSQVIQILTAEELRRTVNRLASQIIESCSVLSSLVLLGIPTRGVPLAVTIAKQIKTLENIDIPTGAIDITAYRDDLDRNPLRAIGKTYIPSDLDDKFVVLIDDVIYSGRTIGASLSAIKDIGRPQAVRLAVLVDRGHRELPIHADFVGKVLPTAKDEQVKVFLQDPDGRDAVELIKRPIS